MIMKVTIKLLLLFFFGISYYVSKMKEKKPVLPYNFLEGMENNNNKYNIVIWT